MLIIMNRFCLFRWASSEQVGNWVAVPYRQPLKFWKSLHFSLLISIMSSDWIPNQYPAVRRSVHVDVYQTLSRGSVCVPDPYQWLESDSKETEEWVLAQQGFTREYLDRIPDLPWLRSAFKDCLDYEKVRPSSFGFYKLAITKICSSLVPILVGTIVGIGSIIVVWMHRCVRLLQCIIFLLLTLSNLHQHCIDLVVKNCQISPTWRTPTLNYTSMWV